MTRILTIIALLFATPAWAEITLEEIISRGTLVYDNSHRDAGGLYAENLSVSYYVYQDRMYRVSWKSDKVTWKSVNDINFNFTASEVALNGKRLFETNHNGAIHKQFWDNQASYYLYKGKIFRIGWLLDSVELLKMPIQQD